MVAAGVNAKAHTMLDAYLTHADTQARLAQVPIYSVNLPT